MKFYPNWKPKDRKPKGLTIKFGRWLTSGHKYLYCRVLINGYIWTPFCLKYEKISPTEIN